MDKYSHVSPVATRIEQRKPEIPDAIDRLAAVAEYAAKTLEEFRNRLSPVIVARDSVSELQTNQVRPVCSDLAARIRGYTESLEITVEGFQQLLKSVDI